MNVKMRTPKLVRDLDGSVTPNQGVRILMEDGSRIVVGMGVD